LFANPCACRRKRGHAPLLRDQSVFSDPDRTHTADLRHTGIRYCHPSSRLPGCPSHRGLIDITRLAFNDAFQDLTTSRRRRMKLCFLRNSRERCSFGIVRSPVPCGIAKGADSFELGYVSPDSVSPDFNKSKCRIAGLDHAHSHRLLA